LLWEFHKVHHSAQVLTPVTAYRMHPVDDLLSMSMAGLLAGGAQGVFNFLQPDNPGPVMVLGLNALLFGFYLAGYNLRHSHIWLSYGPVLGRIFISPAQHQIHHSKAPRHLDKNFGFIFAFWDGCFGSLYLPRGKENIDIGLTNREDEEYSSIRRLYFLPFVKATSNGVRAASVMVLALLLVFMSAQSVMVVHAALNQGPGESRLARADVSPEPGVVSHISGVASVFLEDLTWVEVRALIDEGVKVAIVPTGGTEQNGPHVVLGKHNHIVRHAAGEIARQLGSALVAPVIAYVPEGNADPPSGHMRYAGTLSVPEAVFETVLEHTARSLKAHGFKLICFVGDSGGNQKSQRRIADRLNRQWRDSGVRVLHVGEYYFGNGQIEWLTDRGETRKSIGTHAGIRDTSELLYVHPDGVRGKLLTPGSSPETTGADGDPSKASTGRGEILVNLKVSAAVRQIREELARIAARPAPSRPRPHSFAISP
jgi:creatinine amidohydrolase/Fe(II)-dependent formamide hydrolase-like protein